MKKKIDWQAILLATLLLASMWLLTFKISELNSELSNTFQIIQESERGNEKR